MLDLPGWSEDREEPRVREQLLARLRQVGVDPEDLATARRTPWEVWLLLHDR